MRDVVIWFTYHRGFIVALIGLGLWAGAYYWYFGKRLIIPYFKRGEAHSWRVDLVNRKSITRGKEDLY
ncbi:MAG TPA: hypothetical protein VMB71_14670 [Acetobacteraceae bacterium]|nr:hypothetical protein [Acetobacteraceae bacterium]